MPSIRPRPPAWLKPWVIPTWNAAVHGGRWLGDRARAAATGRVGRCAVCDRVGLMVYRRRVIPPELARRWALSERLARAVARKESLDCSRCGSKLRGRRLARALLDLVAVEAPARSLAAWARTDPARRLRVAEINRIDGVHEALGPLPRFHPSDFLDGAEPGATINGVRHEDLSRLTYPDRSFDLVLTSETLEHVPDLLGALGEIRRVLVPGGWHVCTIPLLPTVAATFPRARLADDGAMVDLAPPIRHPGGDTGWPVFTEFGADFAEIVRRAGFEVESRFGPATLDDVAQVYLCRRPLDG